MSRPVDRVVVVGRDAALWLTSLSLHRALGATGVQVQAVELPSELAPADVYPAIPAIEGLHRLLGFPEPVILKAAGATYTLGQRFTGWSATEPPFIHAYDTQGASIGGVEFLQFWAKARREGLKVPLEDFSLAAAAAKQSRFVQPSDAAKDFSRAAVGYHLDAPAYVRLLKQRAVRLGIALAEGRLAGVAAEGAAIRSVTLDDGRTFEGELFVDATGAEAALIGQLPGDGFTSWRRWLTCDRMLRTTTGRIDPPPAFTQVAAFREGWFGLYPLQHRTGVVAMYDSAQVGDAEIQARLQQMIGFPLFGEPALTRFEPGARSQPWIGNCVTVGQGAISLDPLDAAQLHVIHLGVSLLVAMFPVDADAMPEAGAYNTNMAGQAQNLRDFQIAHYKLNGRAGEPLWDRARKEAAPESLAYKINLFAARGRTFTYDYETFEAYNWAAIFAGHGLLPREYDPQVDLTPLEEQIQQVQGILRFVADEVRQMPPMGDYLRQQLASAG